MTLIVQNSIRFRKCEKQQNEQQKNDERSSFTPIYFLCGNKGHMRPNFPKDQKKNQNKKKFKKP